MGDTDDNCPDVGLEHHWLLPEEFVDIEILDMPPRYLEWWFHESFNNVPDYKLVISYGIATDVQKRATFPKRRVKADILSPTVFNGKKCYELWIDGALVGLCNVSRGGCTSEDGLSLSAKLEAIYLNSRFRKKGLLTPFLEIVGQAVSQELMTYIMREAQAGRSEYEVTVEADLHSLGGQAAVRILGEQIVLSLERAVDCTDLLIKVTVIDNYW